MTKLVIFDLDGTLLDTVEDLANSVNHALECCGFAPHKVSAYRFFVGNGINKLFERSLPDSQKSEENIQRMKEFFLEHYAEHKMDKTEPYKGITSVLNELQEKGIKIAVASNKYQEATEAMVAHYFPDIEFCAVFGQREGVPTKPNPTIVFDILSIAEVSAEDTLYVGDSGVDMDTATASGVMSVGVSWGLRPVSELEEHEADIIVDRAIQILDLI